MNISQSVHRNLKKTEKPKDFVKNFKRRTSVIS